MNVLRRKRAHAPSATVDPGGARQAACASQLMLAEERKRTREATEVSHSLRDLRERNHFADLILISMARKHRA